MPKKILKLAAILAVTAAFTFLARAEASSGSGVPAALSRAADYLLALEEKQGKPLTPWSYVALAAAGRDLTGTLVEESCAQQFAALTQSSPAATTDCCLLALTLIAAGKNPADYKGQDLIQKIKSARLPDGKFADYIDGGGAGERGEQILINAHIWAVLALSAAGADIPEAAKARNWLLARQYPEGGFSWYAGAKQPDVDSTGMALAALGALGETKESPAVQKTVAYLRSVQENDGGFSSWGVANPESCSMVIQGLLAVGMNPAGPPLNRPGGNPVTAMLGFMLPDGSFAHQKEGEANEIATQQALLALAGVSSGKPLYTLLLEKLSSGTAKRMPESTQIQFRVGVKQYVLIGPSAPGGREAKEMDAAPFIENGRAYVPVRYLAQALGVPAEGVFWSPSAQTVTLSSNGTTVTLAVGGNIMYVNGIAQPEMDVVPLLKEGRVFLPARYVARAFGYNVTWNESLQTVIVTKQE
ncbi:MAG: stalk domain-containing protein [Desulfotomaculales bacterium]